MDVIFFSSIKNKSGIFVILLVGFLERIVTEHFLHPTDSTLKQYFCLLSQIFMSF